ncbi:TRAP transporter large permease [Egibacter rhizosphaerae]|uniref:TRAP transporter large permease n=1 Tax=Egibacter rhizosphaerae TaxID=1670831 RepID=UPI0013F1661F|nr:TRAP transporter large permease [Egibacter rhizosphaerae]
MGEIALPGLFILAALLLVLASKFWLGIGLTVVGVLTGLIFTDVPVWDIVTRLQFSESVSHTLLAIPMFVFMGQALTKSGVVERLFTGLTPWLARFPGKLLQSNVLACTMISATTGSTVATCATVGSTAVPELRRRGYAPGPVVGSIGGASLGMLIPPSLYFILFGLMTGTSISRLYIAGLLPALLIQLLFMTFIGSIALARPGLVPAEREPVTPRALLASIPSMGPVVLLAAAVLGSIYFGIATVTEAAAVGVIGALALMVAFRTFTISALNEALRETIRITGMIMLVFMGATVIANFIGYLQIPAHLATAIEAADLAPVVVLAAIVVLYLFLGTFLEGLSMMLLTLPIVFPIVTNLGYDPIWFAVVLAILIEISQLTPPLGFNLYVLEGATGLPIETVMRWQVPFVGLMLLAIVILFVFPQIATWLPEVMR